MSMLRILALSMAILPGWFTAGADASQVSMRTDLDYSVLPASEQHGRVYLKLALKGIALAGNQARVPANVALVIDRSGSMRGEKIKRAQQAANLAVDLLGPQDDLSVISYASSAETMLESTGVEDKLRIKAMINRLEATGGTALYDGVRAGAVEVRKRFDTTHVNRIILLSDGQANKGPSTPGELGELGAELGKAGISVTTIGLGTRYNEDLMSDLAGYSDGNHMFVKNANDLLTAFRLEFGDVMAVVAQQVQVIIQCAPGVTPKRLLGREGSINGQRVEVNLAQLYGKQEKYVLLEMKVPAGADGQSLDIARGRLTFWI